MRRGLQSEVELLERVADDLIVLNAINCSLREEVVTLLLDIAALRERKVKTIGTEGQPIDIGSCGSVKSN